MMKTLNGISVSIGGFALLLMALIGTADVIGTGFGQPVAGAYELIETFMVIAIFMAVAAGQQNNMHINVELVRARLGLKARAVLTVFALLCSGLFFLLIAWYGMIGFERSYKVGEIRQGQLGFPVWPARLALAVGAALMVLQCLLQIAQLVRAFFTGRTAEVLATHEGQTPA